MELNKNEQIDGLEIEAAAENAKRLMRDYGFETNPEMKEEYAEIDNDELANILRMAFLDGVEWQKQRIN